MFPLLRPVLTEKSVVAFMIEVKPYSKKELGNLYGINEKTFTKWLAPFNNEIGKRNGRFYNVLQVEIIFLKLGIPYIIKEN